MYVLDYDHRSDGGPRLVGPFATREAANEHADQHCGPGWVASFCVRLVVSPSDDSEPGDLG